jgi:hypothetical protein
MSSYLSVFIEYKKNNKWNLLKLYGPHIKRITKYNENGKWVEEEESPDLVSQDGIKLDLHDHIWYQGIVRDFFNSGSFESEENICDRGLPKDISEELTTKFQAMKDDYTSSNEHKWWYSETYCTLSELNSAVENRLTKFKEDLSKYTNLLYNNKTNQKLDKILNLLESDGRDKNDSKDKSKSPTIVEDEGNTLDTTNDTDYYEEQINYLWNEDFFDILCLRFFVSRIYAYVEDFAEVYNENDVRIITYIS